MKMKKRVNRKELANQISESFVSGSYKDQEKEFLRMMLQLTEDVHTTRRRDRILGKKLVECVNSAIM